MEEPPDRDAESDADEGLNDEEEDGSDNAHPLLFFYDCEATGLSIYDDNITDIAAKVVGVPLNSVSKPSFSSLVHTPHNIPKRGITITNLLSHEIYPSITCSVRHHWHYYEPSAPRTALAIVLREFWMWLSTTTKEDSEASNALHTPGIPAVCPNCTFLSAVLIIFYSTGSSQWLPIRFPHSSGGDRAEATRSEHQ